MKRKQLLVVVLLVAGAMAFASVGYVGGGLGFGFTQGTINGEFAGTPVSSEKQTRTDLTIAVGGANYFGKEAQWGVTYVLKGGKTLSAKSGDDALDVSDYPAIQMIGVGASYRHEMNDKLELQGNVGFSVSRTTTVVENVNAKLTTRITSLALGVNALYALSKQVSVVGSLDISVPVSASYSVKIGSISYSDSYSLSGVTFTPSVGVVYRY